MLVHACMEREGMLLPLATCRRIDNFYNVMLSWQADLEAANVLITRKHF